MRRLIALLTLVVLISAPGAGAWTWPVDGDVARPYSFGSDPYAGGQHRGIDVDAPEGETVAAPAAGVVSFVGTVPNGGRAVTIQTGDGYAVTLLQLGAVSVREGDVVAEGAAVGSVGASADRVTQTPHVHLGIRVASSEHGYVDPLTLLPRRQTPADTARDAEPVSTSEVVASAPEPTPPAAVDAQAGSATEPEGPSDGGAPAPAAAPEPASAPAPVVIPYLAPPTEVAALPSAVITGAALVGDERRLVRPTRLALAANAGTARAGSSPRPDATPATAVRRAAPPVEDAPARAVAPDRTALAAATSPPRPQLREARERSAHATAPFAAGTSGWRLAPLAALPIAAIVVAAALARARTRARIIDRDDVLRDHADLLRELDPAHRALVHDDPGGHPRPAPAAAWRRRVPAHGHGRARISRVQSRRGARTRREDVRRRNREGVESAA